MSLKRELETGLVALGITDREDLQSSLLTFLDDLVKWNKVYNLTAIRRPEDIVVQHFLDSLSIARYLTAKTVIDVGTGGGFPGIPLAMLFREGPFNKEKKSFVLLDSNVKKTRFLQQMVINHQLTNCEVVHTRAESYFQTFEAVVCRAFASLPDIVGFAGHLVAPGGKLLAMKGQLGDELDQVALHQSAFSVEDVIPLQVPGLDAQRHLVVLSHQQNQ